MLRRIDDTCQKQGSQRATSIVKRPALKRKAIRWPSWVPRGLARNDASGKMLRLALNASTEADQCSWLMLAEAWFQLAELRLRGERELEIAKREASALKIDF